MDVVLTDEEWNNLYKAIDENADGMVSAEEWEKILTNKMSAEAEFLAIMGSLMINDPIVLQERTLDL